MKFFNWFKKESRTTQAIIVNKTGQAVGLPKNYLGFSKEGYERNVVVFKAINGISGCLAEIPLLVYQKPKTRTGKRVLVENSPLLKLIETPNPMESRSSFFRRFASFYLLTGNTFIESIPGESVPVAELYSLRPDRITIIPGSKSLVGGYLYSAGTSKIKYEVDPIDMTSPLLHMKTFHPTNDFYGLSPIEPGAIGVDSHNESSVWNHALLKNQAQPSGVFTVTVTASNPSGSLDENQRKNIEKELTQHFKGSKNVGRPMFFEGGVDWKPMSMSPQDMSWMEGKHVSAREICWAFGYPPILLGLPGDTTFNNVREAKLWLYDETVIPLLKFYLDHFNRWLTPAFGEDLIIDMDLDGVEALAEKRSRTWDKVNASTFLTINERREAVGYDPVPDGDVIPVSSSLVSHTFLSDDFSDDNEDSEDEIDMSDFEETPEDDDDKSYQKKNLKIKFEDFVTRWAESKAGAKVTTVENVSKRKVRQTIRESLVEWQKEGENLDQLASSIQAGLSTRYAQFEKSRSFTIARTESANAANNGSLGAIKAAGIPNTKKEWLTTLDERTRDGHADMDGVKIGLDELFHVPNSLGTPDQMDGPGDQQAPAEQIVNCRCTLIYDVGQTEEEEERSINVRDKRRESRRFVRNLKAHERRMKIQLAQHFKSQLNEINRSLSGVRNQGEIDNIAINVIEGDSKKLKDIFRTNYETILKDFGNRIIKQLSGV